MIFRDDYDFESYLVMLQSAMEEYDVALHGYSLMTTHTHLLLTPTTSEGTSAAMKQLGVRYVLYFNKRYGRVGTLWTGRYKAKPINDERYWIACLRYIEQNPVRARMVARPEDYRWSSYRAHAFGDPCEWLTSHPLIDALASNPAERQAAYRAICNIPLSTEEIVRQRLMD